MSVQLALPVPMRIVERRDNGGGAVEIPLLKTGVLNRSRTGGGGDGELEITTQDLAMIVQNFDLVNRPVPIGVDGHVEFGGRSGPQPAFARSLSVRGDTLFGVVDLSPMAFAVVVENEGFRAFSVEMVKDMETPTGAVSGWALTGGIFTNRPASEVHFAPPLETVAASARLDLTLTRPSGQEDRKVAQNEASLEAVQAELTAKTEKVTNLEQSLAAATTARDKLTEENASLSSKVSELEDKLNAAEAVSKARGRTATELEERMQKQDKQIAELTTKVAEGEKQERAREVRSLVLDAIREGVAPKHFDGYKDDPCAWLEETFGRLPALEKFIAALPRDEKLKAAASSGSVLNDTEDDDTASLDDETKAKMNELGLKGHFVGIADEAEARKRFAELQAKQNKD